MNVPASVQIVKPDLPPMPRVMLRFVDGRWAYWTISEPDMKTALDKFDGPFAILTPGAPREPMSDEDVERIEKTYRDGVLFSIVDIIRAVEAHHGIGREEGK